jgi:hypothetical protein
VDAALILATLFGGVLVSLVAFLVSRLFRLPKLYIGVSSLSGFFVSSFLVGMNVEFVDGSHLQYDSYGNHSRNRCRLVCLLC